MAEAAAGNELQQHRRRQRKGLAGVILACFSASASCCRKEQQLQLQPDDHEDDDNDTEMRRRSRSRSRPNSITAVDEKPLRKIADAFKELANVVVSSSDVEVAAFSRACFSVAPLFRCIDGFHFNFIETDYVTKVNDIAEASKSFRTLQSMVDGDVKANCVRNQGSHSRNLLAIKRGLDFLSVLCEQIMLTEGDSIRDAVSKAYTQIFSSYHGWALRKAVSVRLHYIPSKQQLYRKLNEDESAARVLIQTYVMASPPLLRYIEKIFLDRELGIDWT